MLRKELAI